MKSSLSRAKVWNGEKWRVTVVGGHTNIVHIIDAHDGVVFTQACGEWRVRVSADGAFQNDAAEIPVRHEVLVCGDLLYSRFREVKLCVIAGSLSGKWLHIGATLKTARFAKERSLHPL